MMSVSLIFIYPSIRDNWVNSRAARPFKFQWQNLKAELLQGPGSYSISHDFNKT